MESAIIITEVHITMTKTAIIAKVMQTLIMMESVVVTVIITTVTDKGTIKETDIAEVTIDKLFSPL